MPTTWTPQSKSGETIEELYLLIDDSHFLLLNASHKLVIQDEIIGTVWSNLAKN